MGKYSALYLAHERYLRHIIHKLGMFTPYCIIHTFHTCRFQDGEWPLGHQTASQSTHLQGILLLAQAGLHPTGDRDSAHETIVHTCALPSLKWGPELSPPLIFGEYWL